MNQIKIQPVNTQEITSEQDKTKQDRIYPKTTQPSPGQVTHKEAQDRLRSGKPEAYNLHQSDQDKPQKTSIPQEKYLKEVQQATNDLLAQLNIQLDFKIDRKLNKVIVKIKNRESGEVIRQVPPEFILKMARHMEEMSGLLLDTWN